MWLVGYYVLIEIYKYNLLWTGNNQFTFDWFLILFFYSIFSAHTRKKKKAILANDDISMKRIAIGNGCYGNSIVLLEME